ncbi:hypothetical protein A6R68_14971, partial [Neotoma lepida]
VNFSLNFIPGGVAILPAPQNLTVLSTNMKHLLVWNPVAQLREAVFYSVEYQGEYESLYMSHIWIPSSRCSPTKGLECDVTDDITATVPYNFRVRAMLGSQTSAWSTLEHPFNRNSTVLIPPRMEVTEHGLHLVIKLEDLGPQFEFPVVYWSKEPGTTEHVKMVKSGDSPVHLETMEAGAVYCVKAQALVKAIGRHSDFTQAQCVEMQGKDNLPVLRSPALGSPTNGPKAFPGFTYLLPGLVGSEVNSSSPQGGAGLVVPLPCCSQTFSYAFFTGEALPLALALFAFVGFMLVLMVVLLSIWKMGQLFRYSCCPTVVLPDTLKITSSSQKLISSRKEEVDICAVAVLSSEHLFGVWISQT